MHASQNELKLWSTFSRHFLLRQFKHTAFPGIITLSGAEGDDAQRYQEKQIALAIAQTLKK